MPPEVGSAVTAISGMETLGKTVISLLFILALILALSYVLRRINQTPRHSHQMLRQVASASLGQRERVVVMEINSTWLVLGIGSGGISKLHECPAQENQDSPPDTDVTVSSFADRLSRLVKSGPVDGKAR